MLRLTTGQRELLAEKLSDIANVAAGATIFGQFLGQQPFSLAIAAFGVLVWFCLTAAALRLMRGD